MSPWAENHEALSQAVGAQRNGHNPDGLQGDGQLDMAPDIWARMMRGEITAHAAQAEWAAREPGHRAFNAEIRSRIPGGYVVAAADMLSQDDTEGGPVSAREADTGRFVDLNGEARRAGSKPMPDLGIIAQSEPAAGDPIREAYFRLRNRGSQ